MKHDPVPPRASWVHPIDCACDTCDQPHPGVPRRLTTSDFAGWMLAGLITGNVVMFAWDWRAALTAWGFGS